MYRHIIFRTIASRLANTSAMIALAFSLMLTDVSLAQTNPVVLPHVSAPSQGAGRLSGHTAPQLQDGSTTKLAHYDAGQSLRVVISLQPPHMAEEEQFLKELQTKGSPNYHKFLTADEWNARFAPSPEDEQKVISWATSQGFVVTNRYANRLLVDLEAPVSVIERVFSLSIDTYKVGDEVDFANDRDPLIPQSLADIITSVQGLNSIQRDKGSLPVSKGLKGPDYVPGPVRAEGVSDKADGDVTKLPAAISMKSAPTKQTSVSNGPTSNLTNGKLDPTDIYSSQAYNYAGLQALGHCCNPFHVSGGSPPSSSIAIATFGPFNASDLAGFQSSYPYLAYNYNAYNIDGTPSCTNGNVCPNPETTQDVEWSVATANSFGSSNDTAHTFVYIGANGNNSTFTDLYNFMLNDGYARVFSTSYSCTEIYGCSTSVMDSRHAIFNSMAGQGWTLVAASGDRGATDDCNTGHIAVAYPGSDPNFVAAGGTELITYTDGTFYSEVAWSGGTGSGSCGLNNGGSGGGVSSYYAKPSWQASLSGNGRLVPDLSLNAFGVGQNLYINGGLNGNANGTSVSAPELAGFFAQENAYLNSIGNVCGSGSSACVPIGNPNPYIYAAGIYNDNAHNPFYDITSGCNSNDITAAGNLGYYCSGTGYDEVTGWGSANMMQLAWALNWQYIPASGVPNVAYSGPATNQWYNTSQTVSWSIVDYAGGTYPGTGIAGFTQGWDSIPSDATSEPHGGAGDSFYSGPEFPNGSGGCLALGSGTGCGGGVSQGCHTVHVRGWNNQGQQTGDTTYGPLCYDTIAPSITATNSPAANYYGYNKASVTVTLSASDSGSGISQTYYSINNSSCSSQNLQSCNVYYGPFTVSTTGFNYVYYFTRDVAGNYSSLYGDYLYLDEVAPVTTATLSGSQVNGAYGTSVGVSLNPSDNYSGVQSTVYSLDGAAYTAYSSALTVSSNGSHTVKFYSVDYAGNTEATKSVSFTISIAATTTSVLSSLNPAVAGSAITFTATVGPGTPTGSVQFLDGSTLLGTATLSGGKASLKVSSLTVGPHSITVSYPGATGFKASTSSVLTETIKDATTATVLTVSPSPSAFGQKVSLSAKVTSSNGGSTPTGSITFTSNGSTIGMANLNSGGVATLSYSSLAVGSNTLAASFSGSASFASSKSNTVTETTSASATTVKVTTSLSPAAYSTQLMFTATLSPVYSGTATGSVEFKDGSTVLGTSNLSGGAATLKASTLAVGSHSITAVYSGSTSYTASTSSAITQTIAKAYTSVTFSSAVNPSTYGQKVQFTATVIDSNAPAKAAGTITFKTGSTVLGSQVVNGGGVATVNITTLPVGTSPVVAYFTGTADYADSNSSGIDQTVKASPTTTKLKSSVDPSALGSAVTFTATVLPSTGPIPASGTVTFKDGTQTIGSGTLDNTGTATLTKTTLTHGSHSITAIYAGITDDASSTSAVLTQTVN